MKGRLRFIIPLGVFAALVVVLAIGIRQSPDKDLIPSPLIGKPAPEFSLPSLTDPSRRVSSDELHGHWYLFNVWGTWCVSCRAEHEMLLKIKQSGIIPLVGLDWKDDSGDALSFLKDAGNPYQTIAVDRDGSEAIMWGVYGAPETFLVNPEGIVVYKYIGPITQDAWEQQILPRLPTAPAPGKIQGFRCMQCQDESLADSPVDLAADMRRQIRDMLLAGKTDQQIRDFMVSLYGYFILFKPPFVAKTAWLWLTPGVLLLVGVIVALRVIRQRAALAATDLEDQIAGAEGD